MGWLSSLFGTTTNSNSRRGQALHSTHDAFSLPTSSPTTRHPDAFNPELLASPGVDSMMSPSYSYPPQGGSYGYMPTSNGRSPAGSLLPTHQDPATMSGPSGYPPLAHTWKRLQMWLAREYPELGDTLNYGILPEDLANIEMQFGFALPPAVRESYLAVDGQEAESSAGCSEGLFFGLVLLPLDEVLDEWRFWREVDDDPSTGANQRLLESMQSIPPNWVRHQYSQRGWIPLVADKAGNYIGVDLNPSEGGAPGQVIVFGRDFDTKVVLWRGDGPGGWGKWLASFAEELEQGETYEMGTGNESEGSEDGVGYESYYHDGTGGGQGDGGGDSSAKVGLRLTGEYRGWNIMDAWADRSIRRWFEAGVISEADVQGKDKAQQSTVANPIDPEKGTEVAIPILTDADDSGTPSTPRPDVPTISVTTPPPIVITKPPAPLPVDLPTATDIDDDDTHQPLPSPPDSVRRNYADDVESALPAAHPNKRHHQDNVSRLPTPPPSADDVRSLPTAAKAHSSSPSTSGNEAKLVEIGSPEPQDLISYDAPPLPASAASSSTVVPPAISPPPAVTPTPKPATATLVDASTSSPTTEDDESDTADPDTTIRLVGGGGKAGVTGDVPESDEEQVSPTKEEVIPNGDASDTASISSVSSKKGHKKTKSALGGLKKLGGIGKKKGSVGSLKEMGK